MKRFIVIFTLLFLALSGALAQDFAALDALDDQKKFSEELAGLQRLHNPADPQAAIDQKGKMDAMKAAGL